MLGVASRPIIERPALDLADQPGCLGPLPQPGIAMLPGATDPPALARQAVGLAPHQPRKLGLATSLCLIIDEGQHTAQRAHLWPSEVMAKQFQDFGIADRLAGLRRGYEDRTYLDGIGQQPGFTHCGCCAKSTGVSSNTSSLDVLWGHGITSRQRNGPMRSKTPAMLRLGSSP